MALANLNHHLTALIPSAAVDIVGFYDKDFNQVFSKARPMKAIIKESSKVMEHPLEQGATMVDHRVILPIEIEILVLLNSEDPRDVYQQIKQVFLSASLLNVQTRAAVYSNQLMYDIPHEEDPEIYDAFALSIKLKEALLVTAQEGKIAPRNKKNSSTTNRGNQQGKEASKTDTEKTSLLYRAFK